MVIKFDHISYVASRHSREELLKQKNGFVFKEDNLVNLDIKHELMQYSQMSHDLYFYDGSIPTEYIFYDDTGENTSVYIEDGTVFGMYSDKEEAVEFLTGIFGKKVEIMSDVIRCNMKGVLDKKDYWLELKPCSSKISTFLDDAGYGSIAVITNSFFNVLPRDGVCTAHDTLKVNDRLLDICFTMSASVNLIFEIIMVKTGE